MNKLKLLKIIVAILTFLIIFGMLSAIGIILKKTSSPTLKNFSQSLNQPIGSHIHSFQLDNNNNIYLLIKNDNDGDKIIIINTQQKELSTSEIKLY